MCGIVAVLAQPTRRAAPDPTLVAAAIEAQAAEVDRVAADLREAGVAALDAVIAALAAADEQLRGPAGLRALLDPAGRARVEGAAAALDEALDRMERSFDATAGTVDPADQEGLYAAAQALRDVSWAIGRDRVGLAHRVAGLRSGRPAGPDTNLDGWWALALALSALDRLEVRGRDSAGLHVLVGGVAPTVWAEAAAARGGHPAFLSGSVRADGPAVGFVYKAAAEIGELGDNTRRLSAELAADVLLARVIEDPSARVTVVGHTRWASVGIISEANAHPVDGAEAGRPAAPHVVAALNGDVDNHAELRQAFGLSAHPDVTTDAKVIPTLVAREVAAGRAVDVAFFDTVQRFEGSVAIALSAAATVDQLHLALCGSGQSLYVGLAPDAFVVASEPYGVVEATPRYLRLDGESTRGELVILDRRGAGTLGAVTRRRYSGAERPPEPAEVVTAEITTRDVDRRGFPHYLLKEITESPDSFRRTLRGRVVAGPGGELDVRLGSDALPPEVVAAVAGGSVRRILVVGQGTAAVAGQAVAAALRYCLDGIDVDAMPATELSGFGLADDMSDTLLVAISQSGTTTDTNRTVDLARNRGAHVVAVVNRRNSDLAAKAHGVIHTSDGRDIEMSVASTKAFYAQVAAGWLLAVGLSGVAPAVAGLDADRRQRLLGALARLPEAMERILAGREEIGRIAAAVAPYRRYWAVVGSGPDRVAAAEVRIKLSELCYRSISADATEDKKHIDLSCEPLILVCAAGLRGPTADDAAKEVAIYRAHKAVPVVVAAEGEDARFRAAARDVVVVPATEPALAFVLAAMVGHLFGYEAALCIDAQARTLRGVRAVVETAVGPRGEPDLESARRDLAAAAAPFLDGLRAGAYDGNLEASTAVRLVSLLRYATGVLPLEGYESETGKIGTPAALAGDLLDALNRAIDELTRPIDAIKHQAKTVTVGISRSEDALFDTPLVRSTLAAGAAPDALGYRALRTLEALDDAVEEVLGYTRYRIDWSATPPAAAVVDQGGIATRLPPSRTTRDPRLLGSKHRAAEERKVTVVRGASDGRTVILVPEAKGLAVTGMTLLHVSLKEHLPPERAAAVLAGYQTRLNALVDAVTETEPVFDLERLGEEPLVDLLTEPVYALARRWRAGS
jgi:glucosamine--fructose-6-phosphate aminotransferase (isomerizing)